MLLTIYYHDPPALLPRILSVDVLDEPEVQLVSLFHVSIGEPD